MPSVLATENHSSRFCYNLRPLHESVAKEKSGEILLIEAENEANNWLLASFSTKSSEISTIFTRHPPRVKVSTYGLPIL